MNERYAQILQDLQSKSNLRVFPDAVPAISINLSSNDYLGLAENNELRQEFTDTYGANLRMTSSSSRLLTGNNEYCSQLEDLLKMAYRRESALLFNSGYHANIGILPALVGKRDVVLADKLVHASIIDGLRLCSGEVKRFNHCNYEHLERLLIDCSGKYEMIFIVTESIFSMDGDISDLQQLVALKKKYNAFLYVDEAHAVGATGQQGLGECEVQNVTSEIDCIVGTFGKALASYGAFAIVDAVICKYLITTARSLIFSTSLAPATVAWSYFIYQKQLKCSDLRINLQDISKQLRNRIGCSVSQSHIIPYVVGENEKAVALSKYMRSNGLHVLPIRHPTVPQGTARLRFSLSAQLDSTVINRIAKVLTEGVAL